MSASCFSRARRKISAASGVVRDASVRLRDDANKSRKPSRVAQLFGDLVQSGFFQRDRDCSFCFLTFNERAFGRAKFAAKQKEDRSLFCDRALRRRGETDPRVQAAKA